MNRLFLFLSLIICFSVDASAPARADAGIQVLTSFVPAPNGLNPQASLVQGTDGSLYGTTSLGGPYANGTIFKVLPTGAIVTLHSLNGTTEGSNPSGLIQGSDGNLYGTAEGDFGDNPSTIFKITPKGVFTVLASLDIQTPTKLIAGLVQGPDGNFYGLNENVVFRMTPAGAITNVATVTGDSGGTEPISPLIVGADGNIYGTYYDTIFKMTLDGTVTKLVQSQYTFSYTNLIQGSDGNFYGLSFAFSSDDIQMFKMTPGGTLTLMTTPNSLGQILGFYQGADGNFYGTSDVPPLYTTQLVFKLTPSGTATIIGSLVSGPDAQYGSATVIQGRNGIFYGNTVYGGVNGNGTLFRLTAAGKVTTLYSFQQTGAYAPIEALVEGAPGTFYGASTFGGLSDNGTIYEVTSAGVMRTLTSFGGAAGDNPTGLTQGKDGNFYGTTNSGGAYADGTFFKITPQGAYSTIKSFSGYVFNVDTLIAGLDGDFYATTPAPNGSILEITPQGKLSTLASFSLGTSGGASIDSSLVQGKNGMIYGTTSGGGQYGSGSFFTVTPTGHLTTLLSFDNVISSFPVADLFMGLDGIIYSEGGFGTILKITPQGVATTFSTLGNVSSFAQGGLVQDSNGTFYGVTHDGGTSNGGTVFSMDHLGNITVLGNFDYPSTLNGPNKLVLGKDGNLYGSIDVGGTANCGYVFRVVLPHPASAPRPARSR